VLSSGGTIGARGDPEGGILSLEGVGAGECRYPD